MLYCIIVLFSECLHNFVSFCSSYDVPTVIAALVGKQVTGIQCGSSYSAAVTSLGELYMWGRGIYGRLGHGGSDDLMTPSPVTALKGQRVIDVACGSGDAQTLAVTQSGKNRISPVVVDMFCLQNMILYR